VQGRVKNEADEVAEVAQANASAHPRAVMVVHFNADSAVAAVVGARGSHYLARSTVREVFDERLLKFLVLREFENVDTVEGLDWAQFFHCIVALLSFTIGNLVRFLVVDLF